MQRTVSSFAAGCILAITVHAAETTAWTPHGEKEFVGHALDYETGKPVAGAWVVATYVTAPGGRCAITEVVRADSQGAYTLPFYNGLPPQFLETFAHRYKDAPSPRQISRDRKTLEWIVTTTKLVNGKGVIAATEGPFPSEEAALIASHQQRDVWLTPFIGTDDEWISRLSTFGVSAEAGCASFLGKGLVDWLEAVLREVNSMPDSKEKLKAIERAKARIDFANEMAGQGSRK